MSQMPYVVMMSEGMPEGLDGDQQGRWLYEQFKVMRRYRLALQRIVEHCKEAGDELEGDDIASDCECIATGALR